MQGYRAFSTPAPAMVTRAKRKQVKMVVCPLDFTSPSVSLTGKFSFPSARIVRLHVSGAMKRAHVKDARSMALRTCVLTGCIGPGRSGSTVVLTSVRANSLPLKGLRTQVSSGLPKLHFFSYFLVGFPANAEGAWPATRIRRMVYLPELLPRSRCSISHQRDTGHTRTTCL